MLLLGGCQLTQPQSKNNDINEKNSALFDKYGACYVHYDTGISKELLMNRVLSRGVGFQRQSNGIVYGSSFEIFTTPNYARRKIEVSTSNDYVELSMDEDSRAISKDRDLGAALTEKDGLSVGFFSTDKDYCLKNHTYWNGGKVELVDIKVLQSNAFDY
ncbi:hypothetical protein CGU00_17040 [Vibrio metoecus]|nr:hypothetical protein CGU00_17040 [Vibrio metoecus]PAR62106.1 hypothetical protein CGT90_08550 [Vibrio metoecus]